MIPSLNKINNQISNKKNIHIEERNKNQEQNFLNILDAYFSSLKSKALTGEIPLKFILDAPKNFYSKYDDMVRHLHSYMQNELNNNGKGGVIAKAKDDPVNFEAKEDALDVIRPIIYQYDSLAASGSYNALLTGEKLIVQKLAINELIGLGPLQPLFDDYQVREIICNGPFDIQVEISGLLRRVKSIKFRSTQHLTELINKLYNTTNRSISPNNPEGHTRLSDNSRIYCCVSPITPIGGPTMNLRRHTSNWVSPEDLLNWGSLSKDMMIWLGNLIHRGANMVIIGGTGTGKTTFLGAMTGFIPNTQRVLTIEKNIEIKGCPGKLFAPPLEAVQSKAGSTMREITLRDLVQSSTQMRPDVIILGEAVGPEAYDILNAANTGHIAYTTIHSDSAQDGIKRLESLVSMTNLITGKASYEAIGTAFDIAVTLKRFNDGSRKIVSIDEISRIPMINPENKELYLPTTPIWVFEEDPNTEKLSEKITGTWKQVNEISKDKQQKLRLDKFKGLNFDDLRRIYMEAIIDSEE